MSESLTRLVGPVEIYATEKPYVLSDIGSVAPTSLKVKQHLNINCCILNIFVHIYQNKCPTISIHKKTLVNKETPSGVGEG